jgi:hypothetical protein
VVNAETQDIIVSYLIDIFAITDQLFLEQTCPCKQAIPILTAFLPVPMLPAPVTAPITGPVPVPILATVSPVYQHLVGPNALSFLSSLPQPLSMPVPQPYSFTNVFIPQVPITQ